MTSELQQTIKFLQDHGLMASAGTVIRYKSEAGKKLSRCGTRVSDLEKMLKTLVAQIEALTVGTDHKDDFSLVEAKQLLEELWKKQ